MKPEERKELVDIFFSKDDTSYEVLTQDYYTEMQDEEEFLTGFFEEAFGFCGCGCLSMSIKFVRDILNCYEDDEEEGWYSPHLILDKAKEVCGNDNITDFMLHWLDAVELTEHGTSIYGSWLTNKGKALRNYLKKVEEEEPKDICTGHLCGICDKFSVLRADGELYQYGCAAYNNTIPAVGVVRDIRPKDFGFGKEEE